MKASIKDILTKKALAARKDLLKHVGKPLPQKAPSQKEMNERIAKELKELPKQIVPPETAFNPDREKKGFVPISDESPPKAPPRNRKRYARIDSSAAPPSRYRAWTSGP